MCHNNICKPKLLERCLYTTKINRKTQPEGFSKFSISDDFKWSKIKAVSVNLLQCSINALQNNKCIK